MEDIAAVILAAGFGTRIKGRIGKAPKALIQVSGETLLDRICDQLEEIPQIKSVHIVCNALSYELILAWSCSRRVNSKKLTVLNNKVVEVEDRLGAIGDLKFAVQSMKNSMPLLVVASDCYFTFSLSDFCNSFQRSGGNWIAAATEDSPNELIGASELEIDHEQRITRFVEKPTSPSSVIGGLPFYIFDAQIGRHLDDFSREGGDLDAPGRLPEWLYRRTPVFAYLIPSSSTCYDLGTPEIFDKLNARIPQI